MTQPAKKLDARSPACVSGQVERLSTSSMGSRRYRWSMDHDLDAQIDRRDVCRYAHVQGEDDAQSDWMPGYL